MHSSSGKNNRTFRYPMLTLFDEVHRFIEDVIPTSQRPIKSTSYEGSSQAFQLSVYK